VHDLWLAGGRVVDPANGVDGRRDVAVRDGVITEVRPPGDREPARRTIDASGRWILPGLVDTHVHVSEPFGGFQGFWMLARAGVTCALDLAGFGESLARGIRERGTGITIGFVFPLIPGETISGRDPGRAELERVIGEALASGALGAKVLGGHFPCSPEATALAIRLCEERGVRCAVHAGTTATGSDVEGLEELVDLAEGRPVHVAHVNSYCRGQKEEPLVEAGRALRALRRAPDAFSESYLSPFNGAPARLEDGAPASEVVRTCLRMGGHPPTVAGMRAAIREGQAVIQRAGERATELLDPEEGLAHFEAHGSRVTVSFPVNPPESAIGLAVAREEGEFVVTALSTDGGAFPRNTTLPQGLALVRFGALSRRDFVRKACLAPARSLGLPEKGHLGSGADADLVVVDPDAACAEWVVAGGRLIVEAGEVVGTGGRMMTTSAGAERLREDGVKCEVVETMAVAATAYALGGERESRRATRSDT